MIKPKYQLGDVVYLGSSEWMQEPVECPDCLGAKIWIVTTPANEQFETYCRTCWHGFDGCSGTIADYDYRPMVRQLTIGQIQAKEMEHKIDITYMCVETGIGSGTVWNENNLFVTRAEAQGYGEAQSQIRREKDEDAVSRAHQAQCKKDMLVLEDCPRKRLQDENNRLAQEIRDLKRKYVKKRKI